MIGSLAANFISQTFSFNFTSSLLAESEVVYQFSRLESIDQWWKWAVVLIVIAALASYFWIWYRRDTLELPRALGWGLLILRLTALAGIVIFFFQLQKRTDERVVRPSRVAMLVDTSLSMTLPAQLPDSTMLTPPTRIEQLINEFSSGSLLPGLRKDHEVVVYRFDSNSRPVQIAQFQRLNTEADVANGPTIDQSIITNARYFAWVGAGLISLAIIAFGIGLSGRMRRASGESIGYAYLVSIVGMISATAFLAVAILRVPELPLQELFRSGEWIAPANLNSDAKVDAIDPQADLIQRLVADGVETRIGDALKALLEQERGSALSAVIVFTDGRNNSGIDPLAAAVTAKGMSVTVHAVGMGSEKNPPNVRLVELEAPKRVYPGDAFSITAVVQANGLPNETAVARLRRRSASSTSAAWISEDEKSLTLPADEQFSSVSFEVKPSEVGRWLYEISLLPPKTDSNDKDNQQTREVQIIERKNRVLIVSSGPTREYQFVRNLLFRDKDVETSVWLQSGRPGMSQESTTILDEFPTTRDEMLKYDAVVAFDADWLALTVDQIELLEDWVSEQAGGLILIAGPVATPKWSGFSGSDPRVTLLRGLSPVEMDARGTRLISSGRFEADKAWDLEFADGAMQNDFLWLENDQQKSEEAWKEFAGIYSYFAAYQAKPGAKVISNFSDPTSGRNGEQPVYMATHFYGAGRVFFQGSGEMWRVRELTDAYFDAYYTKLIRWVSQGRLLRDSDRGILLFDKEEAVVGEQIAVRAVLKDEKFQPLADPEIRARLQSPSGRSTNVILRLLQDTGQPGVYVGQFVCDAEGLFEMELSLGSLAKQEILSQQVLARVPTREIQQPQRNDALLAELAQRTGGKYFPTIAEATTVAADQRTVLAAATPTQDQINKIVGTPDQQFQLRLMGALMALIGGALSLEWLLRRLNKLA
jgi:hypothetical protein